jgi:hypothetical protein
MGVYKMEESGQLLHISTYSFKDFTLGKFKKIVQMIQTATEQRIIVVSNYNKARQISSTINCDQTCKFNPESEFVGRIHRSTQSRLFHPSCGCGHRSQRTAANHRIGPGTRVGSAERKIRFHLLWMIDFFHVLQIQIAWTWICSRELGWYSSTLTRRKMAQPSGCGLKLTFALSNNWSSR